MARTKEIVRRLDELELDALLVSDPYDIRYCFGYRFEKGDALALVTRVGNWLYTDKRYYFEAVRDIKNAHVVSLGNAEGYLGRLNNICLARGVERLGYDERMSVCDFEECKKTFGSKLVPASDLIAGLRATKSPEEISLLKAAQTITDEAFRAVLPLVRPGVTEKAISARICAALMEAGADACAFPPLVQSGPNAAFPHKLPSDRELMEGEFVTIDMGCEVGGYCSDFSRTLAIGSVSEEMRCVYLAVLDAQNAGIAAVSISGSTSDADRAARASLEMSGFDPDFAYAFGHGIGLYSHEEPVSEPYFDGIFREKMVMTAEPGIFLPGEYGVRIEDAFIIENDGVELLSTVSRELTVLRIR